MVVGLSSSAASPAVVLYHEEAQAADRAPEFPKLLQPKAQIRAKAREACGDLAQRRGGHNPDSERAARAGRTDVSSADYLVSQFYIVSPLCALDHQDFVV